MNPKEFLMIVMTGTGMILALVSVPLILRKIKPNVFYGFRVGKTLNNPEIWYDINAFFAWRMLIAGLFLILFAIGLYFGVPGLSLYAYSMTLLVVTTLGLGIAIAQSFARLSKM